MTTLPRHPITVAVSSSDWIPALHSASALFQHHHWRLLDSTPKMQSNRKSLKELLTSAKPEINSCIQKQSPNLYKLFHMLGFGIQLANPRPTSLKRSHFCYSLCTSTHYSCKLTSGRLAMFSNCKSFEIWFLEHVCSSRQGFWPSRGSLGDCEPLVFHTRNVNQRLITGPPNGPVLFCWLVSVVCRRL